MAGSTIDPRPRNALGMYASGEDVTPQDMNRAYGTRRVAVGLALKRMRSAKQLPPPGTFAANIGALREFVAYDLAEPAPRPCDPCCMPKGPEKSYPRLSVWNMAKPLPIPNRGKAVINYRVRSRDSHDDAEGNERHGIGIEVHSIEPLEDKPAKPGAARTIDVALAAIQRLREFGFGDRVFAQAASPGIGLSRLVLRTRMANAIRNGRSAARMLFPRAKTRAINATARSWGETQGYVLGPEAAPNPVQQIRIGNAWRRNGGGKVFAASAALRMIALESPSWSSSGGYLRIRRADGSEARVPLEGAGNAVKRNPGKTAVGAAALGAGAGLALRRALRKMRK
jgi:hypothetical protein